MKVDLELSIFRSPWISFWLNKSVQNQDLLTSQLSILDLIRNDLNPVAAVPVLLNEHFRSLSMLAEFTSEQLYENESNDSNLRIMTALPDKRRSTLS